MIITKRQTWWISLGAIAVMLVLIVVLFSPVRGYLSSPGQLRESVKSFGWLAPAVIILVDALQVIVAPIPGQAIDIATGYLFGAWWGSVISLAGLGLGSLVAILLAKRFGRPLVAALVTPKGMTEIKPYLSRRNELLFFFLFLLPATPDDLFCFAIGLTSIPWRRAFVIAMLGRTPGVVASVLAGSIGQSVNPLKFTLYAIAVSIIMFVIVWKTPLGEAMKLPKKLARKKSS